VTVIGNRLLFTGHDLDPDTGLYNVRFRYYSPRLARFVQPDPIGIKGGLNLYAYCRNNPVGRVDRFGLDYADWWDVRTWFNSGFTQSWSDSAESISDSLGGMLAWNGNQVANAYDKGPLGQTKCNPVAHWMVRNSLELSATAATTALGAGVWNAAGLPTLGVAWDVNAGHAVWGVTRGGTTTMMHGMNGVTTTLFADGWALTGQGVVSVTGIPAPFAGAALASRVPCWNCVTAAMGALRRALIGF